jgi:uncharacterized protein (DUF1330 family)
MSTYFIVTIIFKTEQNRCLYNEYMDRVKPIVESYGGTYLVRTDEIIALSDQWRPDRVIIIRFPNREDLDRCFASEEYMAIIDLRTQSVESSALILDGI